jgi:hypothetical protein
MVTAGLVRVTKKVPGTLNCIQSVIPAKAGIHA